MKLKVAFNDRVEINDTDFIGIYNSIINSNKSFNYHYLISNKLLNDIDNSNFFYESLIKTLEDKRININLFNNVIENSSGFFKYYKEIFNENTMSIEEKIIETKESINSNLKETFNKLRLTITNIISLLNKYLPSAKSADYEIFFKKKANLDIKALSSSRKISITSKSESEVFDIDKKFFISSLDKFKNGISHIIDTLENDLKLKSNNISSIKYEKMLKESISSVFIDKEIPKNINYKIVKEFIYGKDFKENNVRVSIIYESTPFEVLSSSYLSKISSLCGLELNRLINLCNLAIEVISKNKDDEKLLIVLNGTKNLIGTFLPIIRDYLIEMINVRKNLAEACILILK